MTKEEARKAIYDETTVAPEHLIASKLLPVSRNSIYDALKKGDIENFRIGSKFVIPTAPLRRKLGLSDRAAS